MFKEGKKFKWFNSKKGFQVVPETIVILIVVLLLIGVAAFVIYSKLTSKLSPIQ